MDPDSEAYAMETTIHPEPLGRASMVGGWLDSQARHAAATHSLRDLLLQDEVWINRQAEMISLDDIDERYAGNIVRWLEDRAEFLYKGEVAHWLFLPEPTADMALMGYEEEHQALLDAEPMEWLRRQRLYGALMEKLK